MSALGLLVAVAIFVALAVLASLFGADTRPSAGDPPELWLCHRP